MHFLRHQEDVSIGHPATSPGASQYITTLHINSFLVNQSITGPNVGIFLGGAFVDTRPVHARLDPDTPGDHRADVPVQCRVECSRHGRQRQELRAEEQVVHLRPQGTLHRHDPDCQRRPVGHRSLLDGERVLRGRGEPRAEVAESEEGRKDTTNLRRVGHSL